MLSQSINGGRHARPRGCIAGHRNRGARAAVVGDRGPESLAPGGDPRPQLHDARYLSRGGRPARRLARPRPHGGRDGGRRNRDGRRPLHGRDGQAAESFEDRADSGPPRRLFPGGIDHRRRRAPAAPALPGRAGRHLCQYLGRGEGRVRYLLHLVQCGRGGRVARQRSRDLSSGPVSRPLGCVADRRRR